MYMSVHESVREEGVSEKKGKRKRSEGTQREK